MTFYREAIEWTMGLPDTWHGKLTLGAMGLILADSTFLAVRPLVGFLGG